MIVLNLYCAQGHRFEGWFASSDAFDGQLAQGLVACPQCSSVDVMRLPSGPRVMTHGDPVASRRTPAKGEGQEAVSQQLAALMEAAIKASHSAEDVADRFAEEARKIHYGEAPERGIRGQASLDEVRDLLDEGVPVLPLPLPLKETSH